MKYLLNQAEYDEFQYLRENMEEQVRLDEESPIQIRCIDCNSVFAVHAPIVAEHLASCGTKSEKPPNLPALLEMTEHWDAAEKLTDGELLDAISEAFGDFEIGTYPDALLNELSLRFQRNIGLPRTPKGLEVPELYEGMFQPKAANPPDNPFQAPAAQYVCQTCDFKSSNHGGTFGFYKHGKMWHDRCTTPALVEYHLGNTEERFHKADYAEGLMTVVKTSGAPDKSTMTYMKLTEEPTPIPEAAEELPEADLQMSSIVYFFANGFFLDSVVCKLKAAHRYLWHNGELFIKLQNIHQANKLMAQLELELPTNSFVYVRISFKEFIEKQIPELQTL